MTKTNKQKPVGRPIKKAGRIPGTWLIEKPLNDRMRADADKRGVSKSEVLNEVLARAEQAGFIPDGG